METIIITTPPELWTEHLVQDNKTKLWQAGNLNLWLQRSGKDWLISEQRVDELKEKGCIVVPEILPIDLDWKRWAFEDEFAKIKISPYMADRPLLVKTSTPVTIPPEVSITFFVNIPVWAKLAVYNGADTHELIQMPTRTLSNTWFGNQFEGELCYALKSRACRELEDVSIAPYRAVCPFMIQNRSSTALPIAKICVRVKHLSIYSDERRMWTNEVKVSFRGTDEPSHLDYQDSAPSQLSEAVLLQEAAEKPERGFLKKTFGTHHFDLF